MLFDQDAADLRAPVNLRSRIQHAEQIVSEGLASNGRDLFVLAALEYQSILADAGSPAQDPQYSEIQASLGAVLCLIAQTEHPGKKRLDYLARAETLLGRALDRCPKTLTPLAWARTRANLAIVLMTRYGQTEASADLFAALMILEGVAEAFAQAKDYEAEGWAHNIGGQLQELRNQRR